MSVVYCMHAWARVDSPFLSLCLLCLDAICFSSHARRHSPVHSTLLLALQTIFFSSLTWSLSLQEREKPKEEWLYSIFEMLA